MSLVQAQPALQMKMKVIRWKIYTWIAFHYGMLLSKLFPNLRPFWKYWVFGVSNRSERPRTYPQIESRYRFEYMSICENLEKHAWYQEWHGDLVDS